MIALTVDESYPCQLEAPDVHSYNSSFDGGVTKPLLLLHTIFQMRSGKCRLV